MAVPRQLVHLSFASGVDESQQAEVLDPNRSWSTLENGRWRHRGGFEKRYGFTALALTRISGSRSAGYKLVAHDRGTLVFDGDLVDAYSPALSANNTVGIAPALAVERWGIASVDYDAARFWSFDYAYVNGMHAAAVLEYVTDGTYQIAVHLADDKTRKGVASLRVSESFTSDVALLQLCTVGTTLILVYGENGTTTIKARSLDCSSASGINTGFSAASNVATDWNAFDPDFSICTLSSSLWALAYIVEVNEGFTDDVKVKTFNTSFVLQTSGTHGTGSGSTQAVAINGSSSDFLWLVYGKDNGDCRLKGLSPSNVATTTSSDIILIQDEASSATWRVGVTRVSSTTAHVVCAANTWNSSASAAGPSNWYVLMSRDASTAAGTTSAVGSRRRLTTWTPYTHPFVLDGRTYVSAQLVAGVDTTRAVSTIGLFDLTSATLTVRPVGAAALGIAGVDPTGTLTARHVVQIDTYRYGFAQWVFKNGTDPGLEIVEVSSRAAHRWQPAAQNGSLYLSGGLLYAYDGQRLHEANFIQPPVINAAVSSGSGLADGTYQYTAIWEWTDAQGCVHWSEPAIVRAVTAGSFNNQVTIKVSVLEATWKDGLVTAPTSGWLPNNGRRVFVRLFRTAVGGGVFYEKTIQINDVTASGDSYITIVDSTADAGITGNAELYTSPGTPGTHLGRRTAPASVASCVYQGTVILVADDRQTVWQSAAPVVGEGLWFSPVWQYPVDGAGELTAVAAQDGALYIFSRDAIWVTGGEVPTDNGGGGLSAFRRLSVDVGCIDPRSLVVTSKGIFFQSSRGIEVLTRAQAVEWIGERVQDTTAAYPVCTAATLDAGETVVYFELAAGETDGQVTGNGRTLVLDLSTMEWVIDRRKNNAGTADTPAQSASMVYTTSGWRYAWLGTDGRVYVEDQTTHLDPGSAWVTMRAESGWFKFAGVQGRHVVSKLLTLAKKSTDHDLSMYLAYDYSDTYKTVETWTDTRLDALNAVWPRQQLEHGLHDDAEGQAIRVKVEDATPTGGTVSTGKGATWIALTLEGTPREGAANLSDLSR